MVYKINGAAQVICVAMETGQSLRQNNMIESAVLSAAQQQGLRALITTTYG